MLLGPMEIRSAWSSHIVGPSDDEGGGGAFANEDQIGAEAIIKNLLCA